MYKDLDDIIKTASEEELFNILNYLEEERIANAIAEEILKTSSFNIERDGDALAELICYLTEDPVTKFAAAVKGEAHPIRDWLLFWFGKPTDDKNIELQEYGSFFTQCEKLFDDMKSYKELFGKERVEQLRDEVNQRIADVKEFATTTDKTVIEKFINTYAKQYNYDAVNNRIIKDYDKYGIGFAEYSSANKKLRDKYNSVRVEKDFVTVLDTAIKWLDDRLATLAEQINKSNPYNTNLLVKVEQHREKGQKNRGGGFVIVGLEQLIEDAQARYNEYREITRETESTNKAETARYTLLNAEAAEKNKEFLKTQAYYEVLNKKRADILSALQQAQTVDEKAAIKQNLEENSRLMSDTDVQRRTLQSEVSSRRAEMASLRETLGEYPKTKHSENFYNTRWKGFSKLLGAVEEERDKVLLAYTKLMPNGMMSQEYIKYLQEQTVQLFLEEGKEPVQEEINKVISADVTELLAEVKSILGMDIPTGEEGKSIGKRHKYDIYKEKLNLDLPPEDVEKTKEGEDVKYIPPEELQEADINELRRQCIPILQEYSSTQALIVATNESIKNSVNATYSSITGLYTDTKKDILNILSAVNSKATESGDYVIDEDGKKIDSVKAKYSGDLQHAQLFGNELRNLHNQLIKQNEIYNRKHPEDPKTTTYNATIIDSLSLGGERNVPAGKRRELMNNIGYALDNLSKYFSDENKSSVVSAGERELILRRDYGITKDMFDDAIKEILNIGSEIEPVNGEDYNPFGISKLNALIEKIDSIPVNEVEDKKLFPTKFFDVSKETNVIDPITNKKKKISQPEKLNNFSMALKACRDSMKKFSYTMLTEKVESIDTIVDAINNISKTNFFDSNSLVEMLGATQKEKKSIEGKVIQEKVSIPGDLSKVPLLNEILSEPEMTSLREKLMTSAKDRDNQIKNLLENIIGQLSNLLTKVNERKKAEIDNAESKFNMLFGNIGKVKTLRDNIAKDQAAVQSFKDATFPNVDKLKLLQKNINDNTVTLEEELKNLNEPEKYRHLIETILFPQMQFVTSMVEDLNGKESYTTRKAKISPADTTDLNWYSLTQLLRTTILECKRSIAGCENNQKNYAYASRAQEASPKYKEVPAGPIRSELEKLRSMQSGKSDPEIKVEMDKLTNILIKIQDMPKVEHAQQELNKLTDQYNKVKKMPKHEVDKYTVQHKVEPDVDLENKMDVLREFLKKSPKMTPEERRVVQELKNKYKGREEHPEFVQYRDDLQREIDYVDNRIYDALKKKHDIELPYNKSIEKVTADLKAEINNIENKLKAMKPDKSQLQVDRIHKLNELNLKYKDLIKIPTPVKIQEMSDDRSLMWTYLFKFKYSSPERITEKDIEDTKLILASVVKKRKEETAAPNVVKHYSQ